MAYAPPTLQTDKRGRAYITKTIRGRRYKKRFGTAGTPEAKAAFNQFLKDYRNGCVDWADPSGSRQSQTPEPTIVNGPPQTTHEILDGRTHTQLTTSRGHTIAEAVLGWLRDNDARSISDGEKTRTHRVAELLVTRYGKLPVDDLRAKRIKAIRRHFTLDLGWGYKHTIDAERRIRHFVAWCVEEELASYQTGWLVSQLKPMKAGDFGTRKPSVKRPVEVDDFLAVLPHLPASIADFARVQFLCGMRPGEVLRMKGRHALGDLEHEGGDAPVWLYSEQHDVWLYRFDAHKMRWKHDAPLWKAVPAAALEILERHLDREDHSTDGTGWLLRPSIVKAERDASRPPRKTKPTLRNRLQRARVERAAVEYEPEADVYHHNTKHPSAGYSQAIRLAVRRAIAAGELQSSWSPNQLRHGVATFLAQVDGLQSAQTYLGHSDSKTTRTYYAPETTAELARVSRVVNTHATGWLN